MKFNKIFAMILAVGALTSCEGSHDIDHTLNTTPGVVVKMAETQASIKENAGILNVPIVVEGDANGFVEVELKIEDGTVNTESIEPAIADAHYYVTSTKIWINPESKVANVEVRPVNFRLPQKTRTFTITIAKVNGAEVGSPSSTEVAILDRGNSPRFDQLKGRWVMSWLDADDSGNFNIPKQAIGQFVADDPDKMEFHITNFLGDSMLDLPLVYNYDPEIKYGDIGIQLGGLVVGNVNFVSLGVCDIIVAQNSSQLTGANYGTWNDDFYEVSFFDNTSDSDEQIYYLYVVQNGSVLGYYNYFANLTLTHIIE